jgi:hypothetical protein
MGNPVEALGNFEEAQKKDTPNRIIIFLEFFTYILYTSLPY